uniref:Uncharacterized protein n=1 Tax=Anguilla anguilla TaxID=7936 RepID=A0A0E9RCA7_ANGAN
MSVRLKQYFPLAVQFHGKKVVPCLTPCVQMCFNICSG